MAKKSPATSSDSAAASDKQEGGVITWLYRMVFGGNDPEREKKRQIRQIAKDFSKLRYKFYRPKGVLALPSLAKFFYECYKISANAAVILQNSDKSTALRSIAIESHFTDDQRQLMEHFSEDYIRERAKEIEPKELANQLKDDLVSFFAFFDSRTVTQITESYSLVLRFLKFVNFDFYFVLKKFDSSLLERNFSSSPKFEAINAEYVVDDLKDFQEIATSLDRLDGWDAALDVLKLYKGLDPVDRGEWTRILHIVNQINSSDVLSMIVRHVSGDPYYKPLSDRGMQRIVEPYIEKTRAQVEGIIQKIAGEKRNAQIDKLTVVVFGTRDVNRMRYYTDAANAAFSRKTTVAFSHTLALNYMKAFLLDYFKKDARELQELILVRGKWTSNVMSQQLSDTYYQVLSISDQIIAFDESLSDDGDTGQKLKKAMGRVVEKDMASANGLRQIVSDINDAAAKFINEGSQSLISFGKYLRTVLEDYDKKDHEIIINWKELEALTEVPLKNRISEVYKKLYYFIQLMQIFSKPAPRSANAGSDGEE